MSCGPTRVCVDPGKTCLPRFCLNDCVATPAQLRYNPGSVNPYVPVVPTVLPPILDLDCDVTAFYEDVQITEDTISFYRETSLVASSAYFARRFTFRVDSPGDRTITVTNDTIDPYIVVYRSSSHIWRHEGSELTFTVAADQTGPMTLEITTSGIRSTGMFDVRIDCEACDITTSSPLLSATVGEAYTTTIVSDPVGVSPVWSVISGTLPTGLSLNSTTGVISGTPTVIGDSTFTIRHSDNTKICDKEFVLMVSTDEAACVGSVLTGLPGTLSCPDLVTWVSTVIAGGWNDPVLPSFELALLERYETVPFVSSRRISHTGTCDTPPILWQLTIAAYTPDGVNYFTQAFYAQAVNTPDPRGIYNLFFYFNPFGLSDPSPPSSVEVV